MSEFKGTPGPWIIVDDHPQRACLDIKSEYDGDVYTSIYLITDKQEHDANLISAAPELLEALQDMLSGWKYIRERHGDLYGVGWDRAQNKAMTAISKALGETK